MAILRTERFVDEEDHGRARPTSQTCNAQTGIHPLYPPRPPDLLCHPTKAQSRFIRVELGPRLHRRLYAVCREEDDVVADSGQTTR